MKRVVITGATGAIGQALLAHFAARNIEALVLLNPGSKRKAAVAQHPLVEVRECALCDLHALELPAEERYDAFFHLAWSGTFGPARDDAYLQNKNITYTLDAVARAHRLGCEAFVFAGSQAEYGRTEGLLRPDTPCFPETGYGMAKQCAAQLGGLLAAQNGMRFVHARILSVYGPGDNQQSLISTAVRSARAGDPGSYTAGEQLWDYLHSADAAHALVLLAQCGQHAKPYPLGSGRMQPLRSYIEYIYNKYCPGVAPALGARPYPDKQVMVLGADITELQKDTGFVPVHDFDI